MSDDTQLTTLGNLDPKIASALCYLPIMSINLIASIAFAVTEKENKAVRFHAFQGLGLVGGLMVSGFLFGIVYVVCAIAVGVIDGILGMDGMVAMLGNLVLMLFMLLYVAVVVIVPFAMTALAFMEKAPRLPILAGLADRFV